jgi:hypothetical protein
MGVGEVDGSADPPRSRPNSPHLCISRPRPHFLGFGPRVPHGKFSWTPPPMGMTLGWSRVGSIGRPPDPPPKIPFTYAFAHETRMCPTARTLGYTPRHHGSDRPRPPSDPTPNSINLCTFTMSQGSMGFPTFSHPKTFSWPTPHPDPIPRCASRSMNQADKFSENLFIQSEVLYTW